MFKLIRAYKRFGVYLFSLFYKITRYSPSRNEDGLRAVAAVSVSWWYVLTVFSIALCVKMAFDWRPVYTAFCRGVVVPAVVGLAATMLLVNFRLMLYRGRGVRFFRRIENSSDGKKRKYYIYGYGIIISTIIIYSYIICAANGVCRLSGSPENGLSVEPFNACFRRLGFRRRR